MGGIFILLELLQHADGSCRDQDQISNRFKHDCPSVCVMSVVNIANKLSSSNWAETLGQIGQKGRLQCNATEAYCSQTAAYIANNLWLCVRRCLCTYVCILLLNFDLLFLKRCNLIGMIWWPQLVKEFWKFQFFFSTPQAKGQRNPFNKSWL